MSNSPTLQRECRPEGRSLHLVQVKDYLKIDRCNTDDNDLLWNLINQVTDSAEEYLRTSIVNQLWRLTFEGYAPSMVRLPMGPVQEICMVKVTARDLVETEISPDVYYLSAKKKRLIFEANILSPYVDIIYKTGYGISGSYMPDELREGLLKHISGVYRGDCGVNVIPAPVQSIYNPYKESSYA